MVIQELQNNVLSWKNDLVKDPALKDSGVVDGLEKASKIEPSAQQLAVGVYVSMAIELLVRKDGASEKNLQDGRALQTFMVNVLKIQKKMVPGAVNVAMEKLLKDCLMAQQMMRRCVGTINN